MPAKAHFPLPAIRQIIPSETCLTCDVCCRFPDPESPLRPYFLPEEARIASREYPTQPGKIPVVSHEDHHRCPFFNPGDHTCALYPERPLDCRLYPFLFTADPNTGESSLGLDTACPYIRDHLDDPAVILHQHYLAALFSGGPFRERLSVHPGLVSPPQETVIRHRVANPVRVSSWDDLIPLDLSDRELFDWYFSAHPEEGSARSFASQWIWSGRLDLAWAIIRDHLCLLARQGGTVFMPIPPLGPKWEAGLARDVFKIMLDLGSAPWSARIENVSRNEAKICRDESTQVFPRPPEYVYSREDLAAYRGDRYKSQRALVNRFLRERGEPEVFPYDERERGDCLDLFTRWSRAKRLQAIGCDDLRRVLLEDAAHAHRAALSFAHRAGLRGWTFRLGGKIAAYSLGVDRQGGVFLSLLEVCAPDVGGLPQWVSLR